MGWLDKLSGWSGTADMCKIGRQDSVDSRKSWIVNKRARGSSHDSIISSRFLHAKVLTTKGQRKPQQGQIGAVLQGLVRAGLLGLGGLLWAGEFAQVAGSSLILVGVLLQAPGSSLRDCGEFAQGCWEGAYPMTHVLLFRAWLENKASG